MSSTTHQWYWYDENSIWVPYSDPQTLQFENLFNSSIPPKQIKVDKDRYIDLNLTHAEIVKNFTNVNDPDLIGIQRRYDDHMRRRAVKRTKKSTKASTDFFSDLQFYFYSEKPKTKTQELKDIIKLHGGSVKTSLTKKIDYIIFKPSDMKDDYKTFNAAIDNAESLKVTPVQSNFINSCSSSFKLLDDSTYLVVKKPIPVTASKPATTTTTTPTPTIGSTSPPSKGGIGQLGNKDSSYFVVGTEWAGVCTDENGEPYVFNFTVESFKDNQYHGVIQWVTLNNSMTKYKGTLNSDHTFNFQEYEIIKGQDEVEVPSDYSSTIYGDTIVGTVNDSKFKLKLSKYPAVKLMKPDSIWKGACTQHENFHLSVTNRKDKDVEGQIHWSDYNTAVCLFKGEVTSNGIIKISNYTDAKQLGPELTAPFDITTITDANGNHKLLIKC